MLDIAFGQGGIGRDHPRADPLTEPFVRQTNDRRIGDSRDREQDGGHCPATINLSGALPRLNCSRGLTCCLT